VPATVSCETTGALLLCQRKRECLGEFVPDSMRSGSLEALPMDSARLKFLG